MPPARDPGEEAEFIPLLDHLPRVWADAVQLRLGLGTDAPMSQQAIAEQLGISGGKPRNYTI